MGAGGNVCFPPLPLPLQAADLRVQLRLQDFPLASPLLTTALCAGSFGHPRQPLTLPLADWWRMDPIVRRQLVHRLALLHRCSRPHGCALGTRLPARHRHRTDASHVSLSLSQRFLIRGPVFGVHYSQGPDGVFVKPIFTYQLSWQVHADGLQVLVTIRGRKSISIGSSMRSRDLIISECSSAPAVLWSAAKAMSPSEMAVGSSTLRIFGRSRLGVTTFFGAIQEPLRPERVSAARLHVRPESGIYNRAVLMIGNRTRYARSLLRELAQIASLSEDELDQSALRLILESAPRSTSGKFWPRPSGIRLCA